MGLFCSSKCPGGLILQTYEYIRELYEPDLTVVGGFHSPMEMECLTLLLRNKQKVILCPARSIENMRLPLPLKRPLAEGRLLLASPFEKGHRRATEGAAHLRNQFVASISDQIFVAHAAPGSKTEAFCQELLEQGKRLVTLASEHNAALIANGAQVVPAR